MPTFDQKKKIDTNFELKSRVRQHICECSFFIKTFFISSQTGPIMLWPNVSCSFCQRNMKPIEFKPLCDVLRGYWDAIHIKPSLHTICIYKWIQNNGIKTPSSQWLYRASNIRTSEHVHENQHAFAFDSHVKRQRSTTAKKNNTRSKMTRRIARSLSNNIQLTYDEWIGHYNV